MKKLVALALLGTLLASGCGQKAETPPPTGPGAKTTPITATSAPPIAQKYLTNVGSPGGPPPQGEPGKANPN